MAWSEVLVKGIRGRYRDASGKKCTVLDEYGDPILFRTKTDAIKAARDIESDIRKGRHRDPKSGLETFADYVNRWFAALELAPSTMQNYKNHIEHHLLPYFGEKILKEITKTDVQMWEAAEKAAGYTTSISTWRGTLHVILGDAADEGLIPANPAARRRNRGRRSGSSRKRAPEKTITTALGALLIAERASLLSGRDDEFVLIVTDTYTGNRWGELVGLEAKYVRKATIRVEHQLYELDSGEFVEGPPKDDSFRTLDTPAWQSRMLKQFIRANPKGACPCHGKVYVFSGYGAAKGKGKPGVTLKEVATRAGVSTGTVSNVLNRPEWVAQATRERVLTAITDLDYARNVPSSEHAPHYRRSGFAQWLFQPAATGWYPEKAPAPRHLVPVLADPWPGVPARGRGAANRADACWTPVAPGLTPHGVRHLSKAIMEDLGTPTKLMDERMGHFDGSVQARYSHVTTAMRERLMEGFTEVWEAALDARLAMNPRSPVKILDRLLLERAASVTVLPQPVAIGA
ncbi:LacI family transcriptional regulator [Streptomyces sp. V2]|uniref:LacI family DNA-binding transcriptional regulator n=1 Tax=Streptomyces sp. V2 TaxID=1424099 RepID=UPI000D66FC62|nr:LacI family DNA-binding transcriptional regulator [Streptomyces sp. V2]PWG08749.1 LacI family transcriptional regulator [Streptomyces sp. V2]